MKFLFPSKSAKKEIDFSFFPSISANKKAITNLLSKQNTPFFVTSLAHVKKRYQALDAALSHFWPHTHTIAYSFKTNYSLPQKYQLPYLEVVSNHELSLALKLGFTYPQLIFNGPYKKDLKSLLKQPLTINIDNHTELSQVVSFPNSPKSYLGLRLNSSHTPSRFGFNIESGQADAALNLLKSNGIPLSGLHFHIGSDIHSAKKYSLPIQAVAEFTRKHNLQNSLKYIDLGGGFPSHSYLPGSTYQSLPDLNQYLESITQPLLQVFSGKLPQLILEPGRYLIDDAVFFVTKVLDCTSSDPDSQHLTLNSTINMLPSAWYHRLIIKAFNRELKPLITPPIKTKLFGSSCQEIDCLYQGLLPPLHSGDLIVIFGVGAYNQCQSPDFIFPSPPNYFI